MNAKNKIISIMITMGLLFSYCGVDSSLYSTFKVLADAEENYEEFTDTYFTYHIYEDHAALVSCDKSASGKLIIPESVNNKPVTIIEADSFKSCTGFSNVVIPDTVTRINKSAFYGCNMTFLTIGDSVEVIEDGAFASCKSLSEIIIPDNVKILGSIGTSGNYGYGVFAECTSAKTISIGDGVEIVGDNCFNNCTYTTSWTIGQNITKIGRGAFNNCTHLTTFKFPENVEYVGESAFYYCTSLYSVTLNNNLTSLPDGIFNSCKITSLSIPKNITEIKGNILSYYNSVNTQPSINVKIYNPDCSIPANSSVFTNYDVSKVTVYGYKNSTADVYASRYGLNFTSLPGSNIVTNTDYEFRYDKTSSEIKITDVTIYKEINELQLPAYIEELPVTSITLNDLNGVNTLKFADNMEKHSLSINNCSFNDIIISNNLNRISISECPGIKELNLANMLAEINEANFATARIDVYRLNNLNTLILPKAITSVCSGEGRECCIISYCSNLKNIVWPDNLKCFHLMMFARTESDIEVILPDTIMEVRGFDSPSTFDGSSNVTLVIPKNAYLHNGSYYSNIISFPEKSTIKYYKNSPAEYFINHIPKEILENYLTSYNVKFEALDDNVNNNEDYILQLIEENNLLKSKLASSETTNNIYGDIDGNDIIDGRDATMLLTYYAKTSTGYTGTLSEFVAASQEVVVTSNNEK